jgi:hypothetical protein
MRTKALLCLAALAAGLATTAVAQNNVYSLNIVGYVNISQPAGFQLYGNPLNTTNNDVKFLFPNASSFPGLAVYKFNGSGYDIASFDPDAGGWTGPMNLNPGEGFWLQVPAGGTYNNTFVGEVVKDSTNHLAAGFSLKSSAYPASMPIVTGLQAPLGATGDAVYIFNGSGYTIYAFDPDAGGWTPSEPAPAVGQGFWIQTATAKDWIQHFTP